MVTNQWMRARRLYQDYKARNGDGLDGEYGALSVYLVRTLLSRELLL